jgi:hypothetical protein
MKYNDKMRARQSNEVLSYSDEDYIRQLPEQYHAQVQQERETYGDNAAIVMRDNLENSIATGRVLDDVGMMASLGYGLTTMLDPIALLGASSAATVGLRAGQLVASRAVGGVATTVGGKLGVTATKWAAGAGFESSTYNGARLAGDDAYDLRGYLTDVMLETALGTTMGVAGRSGQLMISQQRSVAKATQARLKAQSDQMDREINGDFSDFGLDKNIKELGETLTNQVAFPDNTTKWGYDFLMRELGTLQASVSSIQTLKGKAGTAAQEVVSDEVTNLLSRVRNGVNDYKDAVSLLDDITDINKRMSNLSGKLPEVQSMEGSFSLDVMRRELSDNMDRTLESIVQDSSITSLNISQASTIKSMNMRGVTDEAMTVAMRAMKDNPLSDAGTFAMQVSKLHLYYGGKLPRIAQKRLARAMKQVEKGDVGHAVKRMEKSMKLIPKKSKKGMFTPERVHSIDSATVAISVANGDIPAVVIRNVVDEFKNTGAHLEALKSVKGAEAAFGKVDDSGLVLSPEAAKIVGDKVFKDSSEKVIKKIDTFAAGEAHEVKQALKPSDMVAQVGHIAGRMLGLTVDLGSRLNESKSSALQFMGARMTEVGKGYAGSMRRKATAGVVKEAEYTKSISMVLPEYHKTVLAWAAKKGEGAVSQYNAAIKTGHQNAVADEFNKTFMNMLNQRKLGKPTGADPDMARLMKAFDDYNAHNIDLLVRNNVEGLTADRSGSASVPQVYVKGRVKEMIANGKGPQVMRTLEAGFRGANDPNPFKSAKALYKSLQTEKKPFNASPASDPFMPSQDGMAIERRAIDWEAADGDLSVMDLLDTEVPSMLTKSSNRIAGWVGIVKSTDGAIANNTDLHVMREIVKVQTKNNPREMAMFDDTIDLLMGRPTRGGMSDWQRSIKELTVLAKMGSLGAAQLHETGIVITSAMMQMGQSRGFMQKVLADVKGGEGKAMKELVAITGYNDDYALLNRQSVNLDVAEGRSLQPEWTQALDKAMDIATFGSGKATAGRALGQITGYDTVRRLQSKFLQRSFGASLAQHFMGTSNAMSPRRLADWGLTDIDGNNAQLRDMFNKHTIVDAEGFPTQFNFDKWDTDALDTFRYGMQRMEAQTMARALVGELPVWMNKPAAGVLMQFRQMGITTQNKTLARNMAFADKEAVAELTLATLFATMTRAAKLAGVAATASALTGDDFYDTWDYNVRNAERNKLLPYGSDLYVNHFGMFSDVHNTSHLLTGIATGDQAPSQILTQVPALGLFESVWKGGVAAQEGDAEQALDALNSVVPLNNTYMAETLVGAMQELYK